MPDRLELDVDEPDDPGGGRLSIVEGAVWSLDFWTPNVRLGAGMIGVGVGLVNLYAMVTVAGDQFVYAFGAGCALVGGVGLLMRGLRQEVGDAN